MTTTTPRWSESDLAAARGILDRITPGESELVLTLTDEEVVILDGIPHEQLVPTPWLDQQDVEAATLGTVALRSLLVRGTVRFGAPKEDGTPTLEAVPDITGPLVLRRTAQAILAVERTTSVGKHWAFCYVHDDGILEEEVDETGRHGFAIYHRDSTADRIAQFLDPEGAALMDGRPRTYPAAELPTVVSELPELADSRAVTVLSIARAAEELVENVTVYTTPRAVFTVQGTRHGTDRPVELTLREVGPSSLRALVDEMVRA